MIRDGFTTIIAESETNWRQTLLTEEEYRGVYSKVLSEAATDELVELQQINKSMLKELERLRNWGRNVGIQVDFSVEFGTTGTCLCDFITEYRPLYKLIRENTDEWNRIKEELTQLSKINPLDGYLASHGGIKRHQSRIRGFERKLGEFYTLSKCNVKIYLNIKNFAHGTREELMHVIYQLRSVLWTIEKVMADTDKEYVTRSQIEEKGIVEYTAVYEDIEHIERLVGMLFTSALYGKNDSFKHFQELAGEIVGSTSPASNQISLYGTSINSRVLSSLDAKAARGIQATIDLIKSLFSRVNFEESGLAKLSALRFGLGYLPGFPYSTMIDLVEVLIDSRNEEEAIQKAGIYLEKFLNPSTAELLLTTDKPIARPVDITAWTEGLCATLGIRNPEAVNILQEYFLDYDFSQPVIIHQDVIVQLKELLSKV